MPERVPPGRVGRLWLLQRLDVARRGAELLDRKRQLLRREQQRLALLCEDTGREWEAACALAQQWGLRAAVLGGGAEVNLSAASVAGQARVVVTWQNTMGVRHPSEALCTLAVPEPTELAAANAAMGPAAAAYRRALEAAAAHAVAAAALHEIETELQATQRRVRAIEQHRIPQLEGALHTLMLRLEELEREERVVTRWAKLHGAETGRSA